MKNENINGQQVNETAGNGRTNDLATFTRQLELGIVNAEPCRSSRHPKRRPSRANWWFNRMRQLVDSAVNWQEASPARPEQTWLPNTHREPLAPSSPANSNPNEQQQLTE
jgi:hypothetical protein